MIRSNHEKASGGPFFRSLLRRADSGGEDLYDIYYYSMGHTDPMRFGLQGPSVLAFTDGGVPSSALYARNADWGWFDSLDVRPRSMEIIQASANTPSSMVGRLGQVVATL